MNAFRRVLYELLRPVGPASGEHLEFKNCLQEPGDRISSKNLRFLDFRTYGTLSTPAGAGDGGRSPPQFGIQDSGFGMRDSGCRIQVSGFRMQDPGYGVNFGKK